MINKRKRVDESAAVKFKYIPEGLVKFCVPIDSVKLYEKNPRRNDKAVAELAELIKANMFRKPIVVDQNGIIRAGNTAYKAACKLGMRMIPVAQSDFTNEELAVKYVISDNKAGEWSDWDPEILKHIFLHDLHGEGSARLAGTGFTENDETKLFKVDELEKKREEMSELGRRRGASALFTVEKADIRTWDAGGKKFDAIITDPPYPEKYLDLWEVMAKRAKEWLKPDGVLVAMSGQSYLDRIYTIMGKDLIYYWTSAFFYSGHNLHPNRRVSIGWKPILIYTTKEAKAYAGKCFQDSFISDAKTGEKSLHEWQQNINSFQWLVKLFTNPGMSILDPFLGSGTTGMAALENGCYFTGIDIDERNVNISRERLSAFEFTRKEAQTQSGVRKINKNRADGLPF